MRKNFPTLRLNRGYLYLDNAATSLKLSSVIKTVDLFTRKFALNLHSSSASADYLFAEEVVRNAKESVARWINAKASEISFVPSATHAFNFLALSFADLVKPNHSVAITKVEHSSNSYPWLNLSRKKKVRLNYLWLDSQFAIDKEKIAEGVDSSAVVVSFAHVTNSLGSLNDVKGVTETIRSISPSCYVIVDACQSISHNLIDVKSWGVDALVFSSHKIYGPDGIAVLWVREALAKKLPHLLWGGGKKSSPLSPTTQLSNHGKFEVGTVSVAQAAGLAEVFHFLPGLNWTKLLSRQERLRDYANNSLLRVRGVKVYNSWTKSNILLFNIEGFHPQDVSSYLARKRVFIRSGSFCSPFFRELTGRNSALRLSLAIYNNKSEIDTLISYLQKLRIDDCLE